MLDTLIVLAAISVMLIGVYVIVWWAINRFLEWVLRRGSDL